VDDGDVTRLSATELLALYRMRELSPVEATRAVLARIDSRNAAINAYCLVRDDEALASAKQSEQRWRAGEPAGLLDGVPVSVKDLLLTSGWPTLRGSLTIDKAGPWNVDAPAVARLREHGAVLLGKTTTPEFGWKGVTDSPLTGVTRNPWDLGRTAGGSSGGAAAAVASGLGPLALGTDGGGSIRIPASFCGIVGLKPTHGRVPVYPPSTFGTLSHVGPMARTVADAGLLLDVPQRRGGPEVLADHPPQADAAVTGLRQVHELLDPDVAARVIFDLGLVRNIGYYTGAVFDVYDPELGAPIGGGGRYDELLGRFGRGLPAVGFALGVDRLHMALAGEERGTGALLAR